ncbi:MAG: endonuclease/exonuclease/phosphatase family protein [Flavobacteriales bacterium]|nr:endonuclease/exonuclease/phosphatase family protein [Flavobacteriales bacterium]
MPDYSKLRKTNNDTNDQLKHKKRVLQNIQHLRTQLDDVPQSKLNYNLLIATWNIREFDSPKYGDRIEEANYYIAEIIERFDVVAIQEVHRNLEGLNRVLNLMGSHWKYIVSDTNEGSPGNDERIAFVYNSRKIEFGGLAGELVIPPKEEKIKVNGKNKTIYKPVNQLWRTPLIGGFKAGWAKFMLCSVHIQWGESELSRKEEIDYLAEFLKKRTEDPASWARKLILIGDFNIEKVSSPHYKMLDEAGYRSHPAHDKITTTTSNKKAQYDRMFIRERDEGFKVLSGGTIELFKHLFTDADEQTYKPFMKLQSGVAAKNYNDWRTYQLSDHQPLWMEFRIEYDDEFLTKISNEF